MGHDYPLPEILEDAVGSVDDHLTPLVDEGLGNSAYPLDPGDGRALAMTAAGLLERAGRTDLAVLDGGPDQYATARGRQPVQHTEDAHS
ncbi:hypothetical protein [Streptomyces sp. NPDC093149]|uniref:hypothetical protein n=1 Tax=Streptomyces sp. NPDC093149 TaxID=3366031 RepID=UPI0037FD28B1